MEDNSIQMKKDLEMFLYQLRLTADVYVVEMVGCDYDHDYDHISYNHNVSVMYR